MQPTMAKVATQNGGGKPPFFRNKNRGPKTGPHRYSFIQCSKPLKHRSERWNYCSFAYSALACFRMGMSGSASFQRLKKSW